MQEFQWLNNVAQELAEMKSDVYSRKKTFIHSKQKMPHLGS